MIKLRVALKFIIITYACTCTQKLYTNNHVKYMVASFYSVFDKVESMQKKYVSLGAEGETK